MEIEKLVENFNLKGKIISIEEKRTGNINNTYIVTVEHEKVIKKYII